MTNATLPQPKIGKTCHIEDLPFPTQSEARAEWVWHSSVIDSPVVTIVLYLHGGGFCLNSAYAMRKQVVEMSAGTHAKWISLEYSLAPEHPFPAALEEALELYEYLIDPKGLAINTQRLIICGDSAGGCLALALALKLKEKNVNMPSGLVLISPWVDLSADSFALNPDRNLSEYLAVPISAPNKTERTKIHYQQQKARLLEGKSILRMFVTAYVGGKVDEKTETEGKAGKEKAEETQENEEKQEKLQRDNNEETEEDEKPEKKETLQKDLAEGMGGRKYENVDCKNPLISPTYGDLRGLPPILMIAGAEEWLLGDILCFHKKCVQAGVYIEFVAVQDMMHCFPIMLQNLHPAAKQTIDLMSIFMLERKSQHNKILALSNEIRSANVHGEEYKKNHCIASQ